MAEFVFPALTMPRNYTLCYGFVRLLTCNSTFFSNTLDIQDTI